jgi:hypothetical protein
MKYLSWGVVRGGRVVQPPRAAESKWKKLGGKINTLNEKPILCSQKILNYWVVYREIQ